MVNYAARKGAAVVPNDAADLTEHAAALYIGVAGDVKVDTTEGFTLTFKAPQGFLHVATRRVYATGTTATNIIAIYE